VPGPQFIVTTDGSDQPYVEFALPGGDSLRLTRRYVAAARGEVLRIQLRDESGQLRPGPELPFAQLPDLLYALGRLSLETVG
jgi:hypothetical protein